ncbi:MAG: amidohydrolase family protein [Acidobacteria bacterium]|nr:amidohydrolase family protein [Acidobacteriota bacterium]
MRKTLELGALLLTALVVTVFAQQGADLILHNGKILTVDEKFTIAQAVAVRGDRIIAVGSNEDVLKLAGPNTQKFDLKGKTVTPGQVHTHTHIHSRAESSYGGELGPEKLELFPINFRQVKTKDDVVAQIKNIMDAFQFAPGRWIYFSVSNMSTESLMLLWEGLTRWDLDKATPNNPIIISLGVPANSGYMTNSKGIEILWQKYGDFIERYGRYWVDAEGKPDGHLEPPAGRLAYPLVGGPKPEVLADIYVKGLEEHVSEGITTLSTRLPDYAIEVYKKLDRDGRMPVRFAYGIQEAFDTPDPSRLAKIKIGEGTKNVWVISVSSGMVDGATFGFCTDLKRNDKAVHDPRAFAVLGWDAENPMAEYYPRGWCHLDIEFRGGPRGKGAPIKGNYFNDWFKLVADHGLRSANTHVQGDASHRMFLTMLERIDAAKPGSVKGWGMDHCQMISPQDIPRAARLGIQFSCSARVDNAGQVAQIFGESVAHTYISPLKSLANAAISFGLEGEGSYRYEAIEDMITRKDASGKVWGPQERLDRATALRVSTIGGARYVLREKEIGSIEVGKLADLAILSADYMTIPEDDISEIYALATIMGGKFTYLHPDFANEYNFKPAGVLTMTHKEVLARRKPSQGGSGRS